MRSSIILTSLLVLIFGVRAAAQTLPPETDFQIWSEATFSLPVVRAKDEKGKTFDRLSLLLITSLRLGQNRLAPVDERIGGGFDLVLNKHFSVSPTYLYIAGQPSRELSNYEHRLRFDGTYSHKLKHFAIKDRNRIEYRQRQRISTYRYRNKFTLSVPVKSGGKELFTPFISDEPYYDFTVKTWVRNDFSPGIQKTFNDKLSAEFFYLWRANRFGRPRDVHAFGVNLKVKLK
jgi:hypothetical protein